MTSQDVAHVRFWFSPGRLHFVWPPKLQPSIRDKATSPSLMNGRREARFTLMLPLIKHWPAEARAGTRFSMRGELSTRCDIDA